MDIYYPTLLSMARLKGDDMSHMFRKYIAMGYNNKFGVEPNLRLQCASPQHDQMMLAISDGPNNRNRGYQFQHNRIRTTTAVFKNTTTEARTATAVFWKLTTDPLLVGITTIWYRGMFEGFKGSSQLRELPSKLYPLVRRDVRGKNEAFRPVLYLLKYNWTKHSTHAVQLV